MRAICTILCFLTIAAHAGVVEPSKMNSNLRNAWELFEELLSLPDQSVHGISRDLPRRILNSYGFRIECKSGLFHKITDVKCARGLRTFATGLHESLFLSGKNTGPVLKIVLTDSASPLVEEFETDLQLYLPFQMTSFQMAEFVNAAMLGSSFKKRLSLYSQFNEGLADLQDNLSIPITFDPHLSVSEKWNALMNLTALAKQDLSLFDGPEESIYVTDRFQGPHEEAMEFKLDLKASAGRDELYQAIREPSINLETLARKSALTRDRNILNGLKNAIASHGLGVECSRFGDLKIRDCITGLKTLESLYKVPFMRTEGWPVVFLLSNDEADKEIELVTNLKDFRPVLAIRFDFSAENLKTFAKGKGW